MKEKTQDASVEIVETENKDTEFDIVIEKKTIYNFFKRFIDIVVSAVALLLLLLPIAIICVVIFIDDSSDSPIFKQTRVGLKGKEFTFYKFRSMVKDAEQQQDELKVKNEMDGPVFKMKNDPRITRVGKFIRKASIDEIPQFWNVLKGDMSIVGPRPPLPKEVEQYTEKQKIRLEIKPGITCYWQIQPKRNDLSFDEWIELDIKYIKERSLITDIKIFFKTIGAVIGLQGE